VIVNTAKINFEKCPFYPLQFDILKIESEKKGNLLQRARFRARLRRFGRKMQAVEEFREFEYRAMKKKKSKAAAKKTSKKKSPAKPKQETNPAEVRKEVAKMVEAEATEMAQAVIGETKKGQLAPLKYLFEMASIYPPAPDGSQATTEEDCLAKILLDGLKIPIKPAAEKTDETSEAARTGEPAVNGDEELFRGKTGPEKKDAAMSFLENALATVDAVAAREIVDPEKFKDGISKIIDGTVECLNASTWAKGGPQTLDLGPQAAGIGPR